MLFNQSESNVRPQEVEAITGGRYLIREHIEEKTRTNEDGTTNTYFVYFEAVASEAEFAAYATAQAIKIRHEEEIIDDYTMQLIDEGVL